MTIAVVTGASSGMGRDFVRQISKKYKSIEEIWVLARRKDKLFEIAEEIKHVKIVPIPCDITKNEEIKVYTDLLADKKPNIKLLVNAAGYGMIGKFQQLGHDNVGMCDLNCMSLTKMIDISLPYMNKKASNIINLASAAAFLPQPSFAVYAATKSYVLSLSMALNQELKKTGIRVTAVCPGPVNTEFFDIAEKYNNIKLYKKLFRAKSHKVVEKALKDAYHGKSISIYGFTMNMFRLVTKILPHSIMVKFIN